MQIAFRTDASFQIAGGHVMRCLTLADALRTQGADCHFISRELPGHLLEIIRRRGHALTILPAVVPLSTTVFDPVLHPTHMTWLGCDWQTDAHQAGEILATLRPDWLVLDHYALDQRWEDSVASYFRRLMVIDDLANRPHRSDLLLDQNLGRQPQDYGTLIPAHCRSLIGPSYALLRPEFAALRPYSLSRHQTKSTLRRLLITMGGVDQLNATGQVLEALKTCVLPSDCCITVVMGLTAPWVESVRNLAARMPWPTEVVVDVSDIAQRMADSDLTIGAAGSTSWERCCLGVPTLMVVLADNQRSGALALDAANAARVIGAVSDIATKLPSAVRELNDSDRRIRMSLAASAIVDGQGIEKILNAMSVLNV